MSNLTFDIATILEDNGFGTIGTNIFVGQDAPPKPDSTLSIRSFGTGLPDYPSLDLAYPIVIITAREARGGHQACETKIYAVKDFMKTVANYAVNTSIFIFINQQAGPLDMGVDIKMRPLYTVNLLCHRTSST